jgi:hypothetical protein
MYLSRGFASQYKYRGLLHILLETYLTQICQTQDSDLDYIMLSIYCRTHCPPADGSHIYKVNKRQLPQTSVTQESFSYGG